MIKILFVCHDSIPKSPGKASKNQWFHEKERHLLHYYYTIFERALM